MFICKMQITLTSTPTVFITVKINATFYQFQILFLNERVPAGAGVAFPPFLISIDPRAIDIHLCCLRQYWSLAMVAHPRMKLIKWESFLEF